MGWNRAIGEFTAKGNITTSSLCPILDFRRNREMAIGRLIGFDAIGEGMNLGSGFPNGGTLSWGATNGQ